MRLFCSNYDSSFAMKLVRIWMKTDIKRFLQQFRNRMFLFHGTKKYIMFVKIYAPHHWMIETLTEETRPVVSHKLEF